MQPLTPSDRREARLAELRNKRAASERMGLGSRVVALDEAIAKLERESEDAE